jgi:DNA-binding transcriptional regulator YdaS (Cro superfamily)
MEIRDIIDAAGGTTKTARICGLKPSSVSEWTRVPDRHVQVVSRAAGIPPEDIRPDIFVVLARSDEQAAA